MNATPNTVTVIRKAKFSAAHFLRLPELSDAENLQRFGPSSNPLGHGHNYEIEVSVQGPVQAETGMVMNLKDLKIILQEEVVEPLDFKNLNLQVDFFQNRLTTLENMSQLLWSRLSPRISALGFTLTGLKVLESDDLFVEYYGGTDQLP
ncbi:6-pyruvoyl trahydropterin synthase family protein [Vampirovibrio chlorellavorus]|uniref:6-pyruvoyl trahydropterin synthase family protein n=1 Tax=Vampirovibrio chlorellavorus TaxID=758823 RepID=UPI0026EECED4|nr:6-carboxytetrahydropterin synthase [Vampirovibrio chlorellavorus]